MGLEWARCLGDDNSSKSYAEREAVREESTVRWGWIWCSKVGGK